MQMINEVGNENAPTALYVTFFIITIVYLAAKFFMQQKNTLKYVSKEKKWVYNPGMSFALSFAYLFTVIVTEIIILITVNLQKHCGGHVSNRNAFSVIMKSLTNWGIIFSTTFLTVNFLPGIHWKAPFSNTLGYEIASRLYGANDYETFFKKILNNPNDPSLKNSKLGKYSNNLVELLNLLLDKSQKNLRPFINGITLEDFTQFINISIYEKIINDVGDDAIAQAEKARDKKIKNTGEPPASAEEAPAPAAAEEAPAPAAAEEAPAPAPAAAEEAPAPAEEAPAAAAAEEAAAPAVETPAPAPAEEATTTKGGKRKRKNQRGVKKGGAEQEDNMNRILEELTSQQNNIVIKMKKQKEAIDILTSQQNRYQEQLNILKNNTDNVTTIQTQKKKNMEKIKELEETIQKNNNDITQKEKEFEESLKEKDEKSKEAESKLSPEALELLKQSTQQVIEDGETDTTSGDDEDFDQEQLKDDEIYKLIMKLFKIICLKELMGEFMWISLAGLLTILLSYTSVLEEKCVGKGDSVFSNMSQMVGEFGSQTNDIFGLNKDEAEENKKSFEETIQETGEQIRQGTSNFKSIDDNFKEDNPENFTLLKETKKEETEKEEIEAQANRSFYKTMQDNTFWKGVKDTSSLELGTYNSNQFNKEARDIKKRIKTQGVPFLSQQFDL